MQHSSLNFSHLSDLAKLLKHFVSHGCSVLLPRTKRSKPRFATFRSCVCAGDSPGEGGAEIPAQQGGSLITSPIGAAAAAMYTCDWQS